jgi:formylglycine-generating enzyme required for sulfatase activity
MDLAMKTSRLIVFLLLVQIHPSISCADMFGSGVNTFDMEFVTIDDPGNIADTTGVPTPAGSVSYSYRMSKYEVSEAMIEVANAVGGISITKDNRGDDKPATSVTWYESAKFVNWLNSNSGNSPAYKFDLAGNFQLWEACDAGYDPQNRYRNTLAKYFLPNVDEWFKAAYYDPVTGAYYNYPTGSDLVPDGIDFVGDPNFEAVYRETAYNDEPNNIADVGLLSSYGTAGQGGNVMEWLETDSDSINDDTIFMGRTARGGYWQQFPIVMQAGHSGISSSPFAEGGIIGFRVASLTIPEPSTVTILCLGCLGFTCRRRTCLRAIGYMPGQ